MQSNNKSRSVNAFLKKTNILDCKIYVICQELMRKSRDYKIQYTRIRFTNIMHITKADDKSENLRYIAGVHVLYHFFNIDMSHTFK